MSKTKTKDNGALARAEERMKAPPPPPPPEAQDRMTACGEVIDAALSEMLELHNQATANEKDPQAERNARFSICAPLVDKVMSTFSCGISAETDWANAEPVGNGPNRKFQVGTTFGLYPMLKPTE